ncbi:MAG: FMN-binding glutamate synthase family protein, partial [Planctomycetaceae bacterium]|nr:FMN-binding glutamate synthase family protein [Planctomycetaceae bacterium]
MRYSAYILTIVLAVLCLIIGLTVESDFLWVLLVLIPLALLGTWDLIQTRHSITRNYPIIAHMRFLLEMIRPEIHQYFIESNIDGRPFNHDQRSLIYERAKNID